MVGAAPAAGLLRCLGHDDMHAAAGQRDGGRQPGQPGADDMNGHPDTLQRAIR